MAYYLVRALPRDENLPQLGRELARKAFIDMRPFGHSLTLGLNGARRLDDGRAIWEEEDYCSPPLAMERAAVLDRYFEEIVVESVERDAGWQQIVDLPLFFPNLEDQQPSS